MPLPRIDPQQEKQAFDTHYNYADCLAALTNKVSLTFNGNLTPQALPHLGSKDNLIRLTRQSLEDEYHIVQIDRDYSYASTSWLPIKGYYLLFNMLLTIEYVLAGQERAFSLGHARCIEVFTGRLERGEIQFSNPVLNKVFDGSIFSLRETAGANLSRRIDIDRRYQMAIRKVSFYKRDEWKRKHNINFRTRNGRRRRDAYIRNFKISVFEFPYYMRIRSNYRDFAFIEGVSTWDTKNYFESYYLLILNFFVALENLKNYLVTTRA